MSCPKLALKKPNQPSPEFFAQPDICCTRTPYIYRRRSSFSGMPDRTPERPSVPASWRVCRISTCRSLVSSTHSVLLSSKRENCNESTLSHLPPCLAILDRFPRRETPCRVAAADVEVFLPSFLNPYGTRSGLRNDAADLFAFELVKGNAHIRTAIPAVMVEQQITKEQFVAVGVLFCGAFDNRIRGRSSRRRRRHRVGACRPHC